MQAERIESVVQYRLTLNEGEIQDLLDALEFAFNKAPDDSRIETISGKLTDVIEGAMRVYG